MSFKEFRHELNRVVGLLGRHKWTYLVALFTCAIVDPAYQIAFAVANKRLLNAVEMREVGLLTSALWLVGGVLLFHFVVQPVTAYYYEGRIYYPIIEIKLGLLQKIVELPLARLEGMHSGDLLTRVSEDVDELALFYRDQSYDFVSKTLWGVGSIIAMLLISPLMAAVMIVLGLFTAWANTFYAGALARITERERLSLSKCNEKLMDILPGLRVIKSFNKEELFSTQFLERVDSWSQHARGKAGTASHRTTLSFLLSNLNFLGGLGVAAYLVALGRLDFGSALAVIILQNGATTMFIHLGEFYGEMQATLVGARRIFEVLEVPGEELELPELKELPEQDNAGILFRDVTFSYPDGRTVLKDFNMSLPPGAVTALVGPSGGGKSTVARLLMGLYRPDGGSITLDGRDTREVTLTELRERIAYVPQDVFLFADTIAGNIRVGRPDATDEEVLAAARQASAHNFITEQPQGYETRVGDGGISLSGGQRQRIAIARAIIKNAPIMLFDEATSAIDSQTEGELHRTLKEIARGKTVIVVAHRPSAAAWADNTVHVAPAH